MTTDTKDTADAEVKNPAALLAKNRDLLAKLADAATTLQAAQTALETEKTAHATTATLLRAARVEDPFNRIVAEISPSPRLMARALQDHMKIELDADGKPVLLNPDGAPLTWTRKGKYDTTEIVPVELDKSSLLQWLIHGMADDRDGPHALLNKAQGSGAPGSGAAGSIAARKPAADPAPETAAPRPVYGLR